VRSCIYDQIEKPPAVCERDLQGLFLGGFSRELCSLCKLKKEQQLNYVIYIVLSYNTNNIIRLLSFDNGTTFV